jgi:o-succinylbenzoate---CoA ligase
VRTGPFKQGSNLTCVAQRPLHAVLLPPTAGGRLLELLAAALDGSGPAILPLDPGLPPDQLRSIVETFAPGAVETADGVTRGWPDAPAGIRATPAGEETAVVIATSGSTGQPKGVELSAPALLHSARASLARVGARQGERWLCCLPATHIAGIQVLIRSIASGTTPVVAERVDPGVLESAGAAGCAHVSIVPTQLRRLIGDERQPAPWATAFKSVLLGGAAAPAGLIDAAAAAGVPVVTTYGMTETCGGCVYNGVPLDGVSVLAGDDGRLRITGPVLFSGYRLRPDLTAAALDGAWFVTSDLGAVDASGRVTVRGRADNVINTGGEKVVAAEVAAALETCPGVREAVVVGRPDAEWGERVTAVVVPVKSGDAPSLDLLRQHVRARLPRYAAPRELVVLDALPLLPSGKPDLEVLRREQSPAGNVTK